MHVWTAELQSPNLIESGQVETTIDLAPWAPANVLITCSLTKLYVRALSEALWGVEVFISSYVQGGQTYSGNWHTQVLNDITSVTFVLNYSGAIATAAVCIQTTD
jgi:hypothetical protein